MKKTILVTILVAVMLLAAISTVNAASVSQSAKTVKEGETVTVTVKPSEARSGIQCDISFNTADFKFVGAKAGNLTIGQDIEGANANGKATIVAYGTADVTSDELVLTFEAKKEATTSSIVISKFVSGTERVENVGTADFTIEKEETEEPGNTEKPGNTENPGNTEKPENTEKPGNTEKPSNTEQKDEGGKKLPQTGTPTYIVAIAVIVIAAGVIFAIRKNK